MLLPKSMESVQNASDSLGLDHKTNWLEFGQFIWEDTDDPDTYENSWDHLGIGALFPGVGHDL